MKYYAAIHLGNADDKRKMNVNGREEGVRPIILGRMRPLQAEPGCLHAEGLLNFHAKMSQYEMQRFQG